MQTAVSEVRAELIRLRFADLAGAGKKCKAEGETREVTCIAPAVGPLVVDSPDKEMNKWFHLDPRFFGCATLQ